MSAFQLLTDMARTLLNAETEIRHLRSAHDGLSAQVRRIDAALIDLQRQFDRLEAFREGDRARSEGERSQVEAEITRFKLEVERLLLASERRENRPALPDGESQG